MGSEMCIRDRLNAKKIQTFLLLLFLAAIAAAANGSSVLNGGNEDLVLLLHVVVIVTDLPLLTLETTAHDRHLSCGITMRLLATNQNYGCTCSYS